MVTRPTDADVEAFLDGVENQARRDDAKALTALMRRVTGEEPRMWGTSMVGFGEYHYRYASGREGDWFPVGFSPRKSALTVYLMSGLVGHDELLDRLGPHTQGKGCLYVKKLADVDEDVLTELIQRSLDHVRQVEDDAGGVPRMSEMPPSAD
jgi:hypothetical protein